VIRIQDRSPGYPWWWQASRSLSQKTVEFDSDQWRWEIETVEINIISELGKPMQFVFGKSVVTLHFRQRHSLLPSSWGNHTAASWVGTCLMCNIFDNKDEEVIFQFMLEDTDNVVIDWVLCSAVYFVEYYHIWNHLLRSHWELGLILWRLFRKEKLAIDRVPETDNK